MGHALEIAGVAVAFATGAFIGNFYHLILHPRPGGGWRVVLPPSCPACGAEERRIWMAPIIWYALLRGRCKRCGQPFRKTILYWELLGGTAAALSYYYYGATASFLTTYAFLYAFLMNFFIEFRYRAVVPQLYYPAAVAGWLMAWLPGPPSPLSSAAGAAVGGAGVLLLARKSRAQGADADRELKRQLALTVLAGVYLGWECAVLALAAGGAAAWALPRLARRITGTRPDGAFAAGVLTACVVLAFFRQDVTGWVFKIR